MRTVIITLILLVCAAVGIAGHYLPPAKYATSYTLYFDVYDSNSPWRVYETAPAAADVHVFQDGASEARATNAVTDIGRTFKIVLTAGEMTAAMVTVDINDATATPLYGDEVFYIPTYGHASAYQEINLDEDVPDSVTDAVLDELLTGGSHRVKHSTADYIRRGANSGGGGDTLIVEDGTCTGGTANTITLAADASATDDIYSGMLIVLDGGTGSPQSRVIVSYVGSTKVATVDKDWVTTPVNASTTYQVVADAGSFYSDQGTAQAGDATTITLASTASATNSIYNGFFVRVISGTGSGQTRTISAYVGATKVATVSTGATDWSPSPDGTSVYVVIPGGDIVSDNPTPTTGLTPADLYESFVSYEIATISDVNGASGSVVIDANDLMSAVFTDYTATPQTLGWLWYHTLTNLP